ncbi:MAG: hypothetical protein H5T69_18095 [Chloroflexi bacterium]|nr:hypothetical protein [Chloroflexota bacterium]
MKKSFFSNERGFTALETAIIMMAFVVVAAVFAFTILSAGMSSTEKSKQAIAAGLAEVQGSLELRGGVIAETISGGTTITQVRFCLALGASGEPVDLTENSGGNENVLVIDYRDDTQRLGDLAWTKEWRGYNDGDDLLEARELAEIVVDLSDLSTGLGVNTEFVIEVKPPTGGVLVIERTTPPRLEQVMDLG